MRQIIYISTARLPRDADAFGKIERISQTNNAASDLSGLLLFDGVRFLQVLEGSDDAVEATMTRIKRDPRHVAFVALSDKRVAARSFGGWAMLCRDTATGDGSLGPAMAPFLAGCDRTVRATFESFARIRDDARAA